MLRATSGKQYRLCNMTEPARVGIFISKPQEVSQQDRTGIYNTLSYICPSAHLMWNKVEQTKTFPRFWWALKSSMKIQPGIPTFSNQASAKSWRCISRSFCRALCRSFSSWTEKGTVEPFPWRSPKSGAHTKLLVIFIPKSHGKPRSRVESCFAEHDQIDIECNVDPFKVVFWKFSNEANYQSTQFFQS